MSCSPIPGIQYHLKPSLSRPNQVDSGQEEAQGSDATHLGMGRYEGG
jgi:hypothetical protein